MEISTSEQIKTVSFSGNGGEEKEERLFIQKKQEIIDTKLLVLIKNEDVIGKDEIEILLDSAQEELRGAEGVAERNIWRSSINKLQDIYDKFNERAENCKKREEKLKEIADKKGRPITSEEESEYLYAKREYDPVFSFNTKEKVREYLVSN